MSIWKDLTVAATSAVPVVGPLLGGAVDGIWTGVETGSWEAGLKAGGVTAAIGLIPGAPLLKGATIGGALGKMAFSKGVGKWLIGKAPGFLSGIAARGAGTGLQRSAGRALGRGVFGGLSSHFYNPGENQPTPKPKYLPTRYIEPDDTYSIVGGASGSVQAV
ncbi:hypothetical protein NONO_c15990 [Nocardia nova SH22a]|uniref:Uncharacterized protein n=1 Tax=Nocardia nova SH22a TaxID=1415166 RepID=W5TAP9_9NOCA|nr:hypothetical protein [Nocardia nova]AHH16400.1 hypothetical protein NONO_c15990 [Nocardia nova SH22a]